MGLVSIAVVDNIPHYALADVQGIFLKFILRELLLKAARCKSSNVSKSFVDLRHLTTALGTSLQGVSLHSML